MVYAQSNEGTAQIADASAQTDEAVVLLDATIRQLRISCRQLQAQPTHTQGDQDALIYLETAEMHLRAARFRLIGAMGLSPRTCPAI